MSQVASIWSRDKRRCWICRRIVALPDASRDHVKPRSEGGYDKARNYRLAHRLCNTARGALPEDRVRSLVDGIWPASITQICGVLRAASGAYYASPQHVERADGVPPRREIRCRNAKRERKVHRLTRRELGL